MVRAGSWALQTRLVRHGRNGDRRPAVRSPPQLDPAGHALGHVRPPPTWSVSAVATDSAATTRLAPAELDIRAGRLVLLQRRRPGGARPQPPL